MTESALSDIDAKPRVTIVVTIRERYELSTESLRNVVAHTKVPHRLIYVDNNSPRRVRAELKRLAQELGFELRFTDRYVSPNMARNIGLRDVDTEFVVFLDNDVFVADGWLEKLIECADETGATMVGPLYLEGELDRVDGTVHMAGGDMTFEGDWGRRKFTQNQRFYLEPIKVIPVGDRARQQCDIVEFHCALLRTEMLPKVGAMDESLLNTREHLDYCLRVIGAGGTVYYEPTSVITYVSPPPLKLSDVKWFSLRWSDDWTRRTAEHFSNKWGVDTAYVAERVRKTRQVRQDTLYRSLTIKYPRVVKGKMPRALRAVESMGNRVLASAYGRSRRPPA